MVPWATLKLFFLFNKSHQIKTNNTQIDFITICSKRKWITLFDPLTFYLTQEYYLYE
jgi:hypothetical protein